jgi:peroxiredoxin
LTGYTTRASGKFTNDRDVTGPTVSDRQQRVIDELDKMQTDDFWLTAAHRNEVYDRDRDIRYMAQQNRETLAQQLSPNPS